MHNIGVTDNGLDTFEIEAYLTGALERYFSSQWAKKATNPIPKLVAHQVARGLGSCAMSYRRFTHVDIWRGVGGRG
jgi:hypothetical protein